MKNYKYLLLLMICCGLSLMLVLSANALNEQFSWYCVRQKNHIQPKCDINMSFIQKYDGYYIDNKLTETSKEKRIYLTFDAGYENGNIEKILDILKEKNVKAAFFILENIVKRDTELVKRMISDGHTVCNHSASHPDMSQFESIEAFAEELKKMEDVFFEFTGHHLSKYYRPPQGKFSEKSMEYAQQLGYKTIFWSFAYADWDNKKQPNEEFALKLIKDNIHNGEVMLLHPTSSTNAQIIAEVIDFVKSEGFEFGTLDQLTSQ